MHEMSIATALLEQVQALLPEAATLTEVRIDIGSLEHLDSELMRFAWAALVESEPAVKGSALTITRIATRIRCKTCGHAYEPEDAYTMLCPQCGAAHPEVLAGSGIVLKGLTVEQPTQA
ncbi:MAG: hydrogenase maturation nickel metallochaperone HypA [Phycisphaerales bacterium]|nr:hydrogenase maturation nickel metallochaperone HypA [Phycisphaerales bacterium]